MSTQQKRTSVRKAYEIQGVEAFYQEEGSHYSNPHIDQVEELLIWWTQQVSPQCDHSPRKVLDLCCGSGEVTQVLLTQKNYQMTGLDPYTYEAYERETGLTCLRYSFADVIRGVLERDQFILAQGGPQYDQIICSFAMHLCPSELLYALVYTLFKYTQELIIITPHKRPELEQISGVELVASQVALTHKEKRVTLKIYHMPHHPERDTPK